MAIERCLLNKLIITDLQLKNRPNSENYLMPPYVLDLEYIVLLTHVCYTVRITNYSSCKVDLRLDNRFVYNNLEYDEFKIEFKNKRLDVCQYTDLYVLFKPTRRRYGLNETKVENTFCLALKEGYVPIKILATVTMPRLNIERSSIDFGVVIIRKALRVSIVLKNE